MHINRRQLAVLLGFLLILSNLLLPVTAQQRRRPANAPKKPRLIVGIVIDQFRADYLNRFSDQFGEGGFKRLLDGGAVFTNANYTHVPTYTACGHAMFMTGAPPSMTGIIGNEWYDRTTGRRITSVNDDKTKLLGGREGASGMSPHRLLGSTIGDELKLASAGKAKVIGISLKDRSAILPSGKRPDAAYWFDLSTGNFVSSTYYFADLPDWVKAFNRDHHSFAYFGKTWDRLLPEAAYARSAPDDAPYEKSPFGTKFPYTINGGETKPGSRFLNQFEATPFANDYLANFAKAAIENEKLGADDVTDLLTISFSANDLLGHVMGPYSQEVQDMTLRTDRTLADLFGYLDKKIGLDQIVIVLTADHGVAPVPEQVQPLGYGGKVETRQINEAITNALNQRFGEDKWIVQTANGTYQTVNGNVYLDESTIERRKLDAAEVESVASKAVLKIPGINAVFTRSQILSGELPNTIIARSVANGFHPKRNGNLVIITEPFYFIGEGITTTHGSPYKYDTHVPVIFYGAGIEAGKFPAVSSPADIAPTLASLLTLETPSDSIGRILTEAIKAK
ncbi:MAG: alkaline phosphatase family protein [Acidobacteria bacterium]|nr:alkaline phosphatase family protein [Acidobacteriota bacterium]